MRTVVVNDEYGDPMAYIEVSRLLDHQDLVTLTIRTKDGALLGTALDDDELDKLITAIKLEAEEVG